MKEYEVKDTPIGWDVQCDGVSILSGEISQFNAELLCAIINENEQLKDELNSVMGTIDETANESSFYDAMEHLLTKLKK